MLDILTRGGLAKSGKIGKPKPVSGGFCGLFPAMPDWQGHARNLDPLCILLLGVGRMR
jgi:hypothetical protein